MKQVYSYRIVLICWVTRLNRLHKRIASTAVNEWQFGVNAYFARWPKGLKRSLRAKQSKLVFLLTLFDGLL